MWTVAHSVHDGVCVVQFNIEQFIILHYFKSHPAMPGCQPNPLWSQLPVAERWAASPRGGFGLSSAECSGGRGFRGVHLPSQQQGGRGKSQCHRDSDQ